MRGAARGRGQSGRGQVGRKVGRKGGRCRAVASLRATCPRVPSPPAPSATRRPHRRRVAGALRAADAGHGGDGAGAPCRARCAAARRPTSSPCSCGPGRHRLPGRYPTRGRMASTRWSCWVVRGVTRCLVRWRGQTSPDDEWRSGGWRSWHTARRRWRSTTPWAEYAAVAPRRRAARRLIGDV